MLFRSNPDAWLYACDDGEQLMDKPADRVPGYLYGKNPSLREYADTYKMPLIAALGGPESMYPEFTAKIKDVAGAEAAAKVMQFPSNGPQHTSKAIDPTPKDGNIHVIHVQGNIYMLTGDGSNIAVQIGEQGALVVDTGAGKLADKDRKSTRLNSSH